MTEEYNIDSSTTSLWKLLDNNKFNDEITSGFRKLTHEELSNLFRNSSLIRKIITKFPKKAFTIGYHLVDKAGGIVEENNTILLKAFRDSSIRARLYGRSYCELRFNSLPDKPVKKSDILMGYYHHNFLYPIGEFFQTGTKARVHKSKIIPFYGNTNYIYDILENEEFLDENYSDSILQGIYNSFTDYLESNSAGKFILKNLSYLLIGIENLGNMTKSDIGKQMVLNRLQNLNENRNIGRVIAYDRKYEGIEFISQTISGFSDIVSEIRNILVSETEYPFNELFEKSDTQSLGSGIQNQLVARNIWANKCNNWVIENWLSKYIQYYENFYDMESYKIQIPLTLEMSEQEKADIEKTNVERDQILVNIGAITPDEVRERYRGNEVSANINIDASNTDDDIPPDSYWESLSKVTISDFDNLAEELIG